MKHVIRLDEMLSVELTEDGMRAEASHFRNLGVSLPSHASSSRYYSFYELMRIFGKAMEHIGPPLFVNNEIRFGSSL